MATTACPIWQEHDLEPQRQESFKLLRDAQFVPKLLKVMGVYLDSPRKTVVFGVDEKSQIQALDRTEPELPMKRGRCGSWTRDYVRHVQQRAQRGGAVIGGVVQDRHGSSVASAMTHELLEEGLEVYGIELWRQHAHELAAQ